jgi:hypothetical protein
MILLGQDYPLGDNVGQYETGYLVPGGNHRPGDIFRVRFRQNGQYQRVRNKATNKSSDIPSNCSPDDALGDVEQNLIKYSCDNFLCGMFAFTR